MLYPQIRLYKIIGSIISAILIFLITSINPIAKNRIIDLTSFQLKQTSVPFLPYSDHHEEHYVSALKMFQDKPFFGIGTNLFRFQCNKPEYKYKTRSCNAHPHNFYIQIMAELGLVGLSFLILFFLFLSKFLLQQLMLNNKSPIKKELQPDFLLYPLILFIYWWPLIPHMSFYNNWNNILMMLPLGFFMRYLYSNTNYGNFNKI